MEAEDRPQVDVSAEPREAARAITREMVQLFAHRIGRGPTKARTTANTNAVLIVFQDTLTRSEQTLLRAGNGASVLANRLSISEAMRSEATSIIEAHTRREVTAYTPGLDPDANVSTMVFLLDPIDESGLVEVAE